MTQVSFLMTTLGLVGGAVGRTIVGMEVGVGEFVGPTDGEVGARVGIAEHEMVLHGFDEILAIHRLSHVILFLSRLLK